MIPEMKGHSSLKWGIWLCNGAESHEMGINCTQTKTHTQETTPSAIHLEAKKEFNKLLILKILIGLITQ